MTIESLVRQYVSGRPHAAGETVQFGWFLFTIAAAGQPPRIETLDFKRMASFTDDFSAVERIHSLQLAALARFNASEVPCTLWQSALVSASYTPGHEDAFIQRQQPTEPNDSGWYVGITDDPRDMNDIATFSRRSLYELTIHDMRMAPYWLLPSGTTFHLSDDFPPERA